MPISITPCLVVYKLEYCRQFLLLPRYKSPVIDYFKTIFLLQTSKTKPPTIDLTTKYQSVTSQDLLPVHNVIIE